MLFHLVITTPSDLIYENDVEQIFLRSSTGNLCIMARHCDYFASIIPYLCKIITPKQTLQANCGQGILKVENNQVSLALDYFEWLT